MRMQSYSKQVEKVIGQHSELTSWTTSQFGNFNNLIGNKVDRSLKLLSAAEDMQQQGYGLETAAKQLQWRLWEHQRSNRTGVVLDLVSMKSMTAAKMDYLAKQMEKSFGGSAGSKELNCRDICQFSKSGQILRLFWR